MEPTNKFSIAKKRKRAIAFLIDFVLWWLIGYILAVFFGEVENLSFSLSGLPAFLVFIAGFIIFPVLEGSTGQTLGKSIMNIEVVSESMGANSLGKSFIRFFFGIIDFFCLAGLLVASNNKNSQRIGDLIAKTIVIDKIEIK